MCKNKWQAFTYLAQGSFDGLYRYAINIITFLSRFKHKHCVFYLSCSAVCRTSVNSLTRLNVPRPFLLEYSSKHSHKKKILRQLWNYGIECRAYSRTKMKQNRLNGWYEMSGVTMISILTYHANLTRLNKVNKVFYLIDRETYNQHWVLQRKMAYKNNRLRCLCDGVVEQPVTSAGLMFKLPLMNFATKLCFQYNNIEQDLERWNFNFADWLRLVNYSQYQSLARK